MAVVQTFTIIYKKRFESVEQSYETRFYSGIEALEDELAKRGEHGKVSYYLYGRKGVARKNLQRMDFC